MDKLLLFPGASERGIFTFLIDHEHSHLVKTAAEYHPTIAAYINAAKPIPGKTQILLTALGSGEWWGDNANGDFFPEIALAHEGDDYGHKTFEKYAKIYKHHINKDPTASYGDVPLSVFNPRYHRVELIVSLDNAKAPDIAKRIESGDYPEWSMGCRVPYDRCNICGNKAPTRKEYCVHARYYLGKIDPETGKKVYVVNDYPKFFDISQVLIGADKIAKTLQKVASSRKIVIMPSSAFLAEKMAINAKAAAIEKEVPSDEPPAGAQELLSAIPIVKSYEKPMPTEMLNELGKKPLSNVLSTMAMLGILPKPQEFQRIILVSIGKPAIADQLDKYKMTFDPLDAPDPSPDLERMAGISWRNFDPSIMDTLGSQIPERSYSPPHLLRRITIIMSKQASEAPAPHNFIKLSDKKLSGIGPLLLATAGLYSLMAKKAPPEMLGKIDKLVAENPAIAAALGFSLVATFHSMMRPGVKGHFINQSGERHDPDSNTNPVERMREKATLKIAGEGLLGPVGMRLGLMPLVLMGSDYLQGQHEQNPGAPESAILRTWRRNPNLIASIVGLDALAALRGGGTHGLLSKMGSKELSVMELALSLIKEGSNSTLDYASAMAVPIAISTSGAGGLPGKVVAGVLDQALFEGMRKVWSKHRNPNKIEAHRRN